MKTLIIICLLALLSSVASADVYTWEDADVIHFTDDPATVPEEFRNKPVAETTVQIGNSAPPVRVAMAPQNRTAITQQNQTAVYQANSEQQTRAAKTVTKQKSGASAETFPSLATLFVVLLVIALFLIITWGFTVADIVRSTFITPAIKTVWMLLVIFIPLVGMELYYILGVNQKSISTSYNKKQQFVTHARLT